MKMGLHWSLPALLGIGLLGWIAWWMGPQPTHNPAPVGAGPPTGEPAASQAAEPPAQPQPTAPEPAPAPAPAAPAPEPPTAPAPAPQPAEPAEPEEPSADGDLDELARRERERLARRERNRARFTELANDFAAQERQEPWAATLEAKVDVLVEQMALDELVQDVECRSDLCRIQGLPVGPGVAGSLVRLGPLARALDAEGRRAFGTEQQDGERVLVLYVPRRPVAEVGAEAPEP